MSNIASITASIASIIAIIGGLIYIWKEIHSLDKLETEKLKITISRVKRFALFIFGFASLSALLFFEVASSDPINRLAALKIALFVALLFSWGFSFLLLLILDSLIIHSKLIKRSIGITEKLIER